jgi:hypothetical protein
MKNWAVFLVAAAAMGLATIAIGMSLRRPRPDEELEQIPELIELCYDRIRSIERDLHRMRPEPAG